MLRRISDALALNIGQDPWQITQVAKAYDAAKSLGTNFKLFISFDFTVIGCTVSTLASIANQFANHPNQFKVDGKPMISSYEGSCLGNTGWQDLRAQTNGYNMPFISSLEGSFHQWSSLDSWLWLVWIVRIFYTNLIVYVSWGCTWPQHGGNLSVRKSRFTLYVWLNLTSYPQTAGDKFCKWTPFSILVSPQYLTWPDRYRTTRQ